MRDSCSQNMLKQAGVGSGPDLAVPLRERSQPPDVGAAQTQNGMVLPLQEQHCSRLL